MQEADDSRAPVLITRTGKPPVVMLSLDEYESMEETLHLLSTPNNQARIQKGLQDYAEGRFVKNELIEEEQD